MHDYQFPQIKSMNFLGNAILKIVNHTEIRK